MDAISRGETTTRTITVRDGAEALLDLTGKELLFVATRRLSDTPADAVISKETGDGITHAADQPGVGKGLASITFDAADTASLEAYRVDLHFAVWLVSASLPYVLQRGVLTVNAVAANPA
jgi:hypothetical protein